MIKNYFNKESSSFIGQPKIFLFQVCQGNKSAEPLQKETKKQPPKKENRHCFDILEKKTTIKKLYHHPIYLTKIATEKLRTQKVLCPGIQIGLWDFQVLQVS